MSLNEQQYQLLVDELLDRIEELLENTDLDLDIDNSGEILAIKFANHSQIIISRQLALKQLWLAAKSGGYHLDYDEKSKKWILTTTNETFEQLLTRVIKEQTNQLVVIK